MKKSYIFRIGGFSLLAFTTLAGAACSGNKNVDVEDNTVYDNEVATYDEEGQTTKQALANTVNSLTVTFYSSSMNLNNYHYYFWTTYESYKEVTPVVTSNKMTATLNFAGEDSYLYNGNGLEFTIKNADNWNYYTSYHYIYYPDYQIDQYGNLNLYCRIDEGKEVIFSQNEADAMRYVKAAYLTNYKTIHVEIEGDSVQRYNVYALDKLYLANPTEAALRKRLVATGVPTPVSTNVYSFNVSSSRNLPLNICYMVEAVFSDNSTNTRIVKARELLKGSTFNSKYLYNGNDLGTTYTDSNTTFKVWAPTSGSILLRLFAANSDTEYTDYQMSFHQGGVWACTINGDLDGRDYQYVCYNSNGKVASVDPYAKATRRSGSVSTVLDFSETNPTGWDALPLKWDGNATYDITTPQELSIYETHVRDVTMHSTWTGTSPRGTFKAMAEKGTKYTKGTTTVTTGFDHIEELGVTAVQLLPSFDYDNDESQSIFNWGYNPLNYNCVEGLYSTNPDNAATRITEFKELILALANNANHTRTIMDVVYNHVSNAPNSCFEKVVPDYYFRKDSSWQYYDGSGCSNEVKSEAPMMSKYIVDSVCWWAKEYKIKGFRFDLMGLIDVQTIRAAAIELYKIDPDIYLYGEGWSALGYNGDDSDTNPGAFSSQVYSKLYKQGDMCYVGCFNDAGRNGFKGYNNLSDAWGFIDEASSNVYDKSIITADMMCGYHTGTGYNPQQCINYVSCHDNYTAFDQLVYAINDATYTSPGLAIAASTALNCAVMFSNGIAFMQGGEELFR